MHTDSKPFKNKVAFISGGSRGIGLAIAEKLAERGANIVFTYLRSRSDADAAEKHLAGYKTRVLSLRANMGNEESIGKIFETIKSEFGHLDFLIHNAATGDLKPSLELTAEEWNRTIDINVKALLLCAQKAVPLMHGRHGSD
jgi:enoyl-[acyl-carrier protein] reductase III